MVLVLELRRPSRLLAAETGIILGSATHIWSHLNTEKVKGLYHCTQKVAVKGYWELQLLRRNHLHHHFFSVCGIGGRKTSVTEYLKRP